MLNKINNIFYAFDFIGLVPQFRILKKDSYKSVLSTIISIIIIISSIIFSVLSIIEYLKFNNPSISFLKGYENNFNHTIFLNDTLFMFSVNGNGYDNNSNYIFDVHYSGTYSGENLTTTNLTIEKCKIGKNINIKFKNELMKKYNEREISNYFCISSEHGNLPLFYKSGEIVDPEIGINMKIKRACVKGFFIFELITEDVLIDHLNKESPIITSLYSFRKMYSCNTFANFDYRFELQRYESDDGYFYQKSEDYFAFGMSEMSFIRLDPESKIGFDQYLVSLILKHSHKYYSFYKRSYKKIQSLLAEIMSIYNILFGTGKLISYFLFKKKMNKDIVRSLINNNIYTKINQCSLIENNKKEKKLFKNINEKKF